ncbi:MAG: hypothetical protein JJ979_02350 [Roseibium sp.]|nr:hypothetical protein [Roseibium sp.]
MSYFKEVEGDVAILAIGGVFKQCSLYTLDGYLFAQAAGGFVRLAADGSTSKSKMRIIKLVTDCDLYQDALGRLTVEQNDNTKPLVEDKRQLLIRAG